MFGIPRRAATFDVVFDDARLNENLEHAGAADTEGSVKPLAGTSSEGWRLAAFFTKTYTRIVCPSLAELDPARPDVAPHPAWQNMAREFEPGLDARTKEAAIAYMFTCFVPELVRGP